MRVTANYLYSGLGDYFGGYGCKDNEALLYAFYGRTTTVRDIVDQWVEEVWNGAASEDVPEEVTQDDVRAAILDMHTESGRADYDSGAVSEFAESYADANGPLCCRECEALVNEEHEEGCDLRDDCDPIVIEEDTEEYDCCHESPICVCVIEWDVCPDCGKLSGEDTFDGLCDECHALDCEEDDDE